MAEIVRIYGSSAAGKETFIHRCLKNIPKETIEYL
jgi:predicted kinase